MCRHILKDIRLKKMHSLTYLEFYIPVQLQIAKSCKIYIYRVKSAWEFIHRTDKHQFLPSFPCEVGQSINLVIPKPLLKVSIK